MRRHTAAIAALLLIIITLFWRVLFLGETLIDLAAHENQLPWGAQSSTYEGYAYNRRDLTDTYVTRDYFLVESYRKGELPLWNPYIFSGHPTYADGVTKLFSPFNLLYLVFDVPLGYSIARLIELALAAIFFYVFLINLGISPGGAFTGSVVFALSDHVMHHVTWLGWLGGLMWLPLMLLGADRALRGKNILPAVGAGVALAMQFYCGFVPAAIYYLAALSAYYPAAALLSAEAGKRMAALKQSIKFLSISLVVGFGLSAPIWMPVFELLGVSNRKIVPTEIGYIWLPPWQLLTLLLPRAFGEAFDPQSVQMFLEMGVSQDRSVYLGLSALPLIALALRKPQDRRVYYFAGLAAFALLVMTCAPIYVHATKYIPVLRTIRAITRINVLYTFGGAVLAAYGAHCLLTMDRSRLVGIIDRSRRLGLYWFGMLIGAVLIFKAISAYLPQKAEGGNRIFRSSVKIGIALADQFRLSADNFDLIAPALILTALIVLFHLFSKNNLSAAALLVGMTALLVCDLVWSGSQYNATYRRDLIYRPTAAADFLKARLGNHRTVVVPAEFAGKAGAVKGRKIVAPPNTLVPYSIASISGKNQLYPKWYRELTSLIEPQKNLSHIIFDRERSPLYDLLGVKYLMTREANEFDSPEYKEVFRGDGVRIYENLSVMPRAFFAPKPIIVKTHDEALELMKREDFDPLTTVAAESDEAGEAIESSVDGDRVEVASYKNNEAVLRASCAGTRLLVLSDTYYPGWEAFIDGAPAKLLRVDGALRGAAVKAGDHEVRFVFRPKSFRNGLVISAATLLLCIFLFFLPQRTQRAQS